MKSELVKIAKDEFNKNTAIVHFLEDDEQNAFLNDLKKYPHAFVLACLMDKQMKAERAWEIPYKVYKELGRFDIDFLASVPLNKYKELFNKGSYHRFNDTQATYFYNAIIRIKDKYNGDASKIWSNNPSSASVVSKFLEFEGIGIKMPQWLPTFLQDNLKY